MRILHENCLGTNAFDSAKRLDCGASAPLCVGRDRPSSSESGGKPPHSPAAAGLRDLGAELSRSDCHNEHRPKDLDDLDIAAPRNHSGAFLR